ncbi:MAG: triose-phosphate isomerase [Candidatus Kerfeldbacteria bacterium]
MNKKPYIVANWKMSLDKISLERFFDNMDWENIDLEKINVILCPSHVFMCKTRNQIGDKTIGLGAQNIFWEASGAFTGEVSAKQLVDVGCQYVIVGHSERREIFHETNEVVNLKIVQALKNKLKPIICIGENFEEKENGLTKKVIEEKLNEGLQDISPADMRNVLIAYEPIWAISTNKDNTGQADSPESAQVVHKYIRKLISGLYDVRIAENLPILYGGSINPENIEGFSKMDDIDGVLIGGASKEASSFQKIINTYL